MNAGEVNAARAYPHKLSTSTILISAAYFGYVTNRTINGVLAQQAHGSAIVLEHRFFGESNPYPNLNVESLRYHTVAQAIEDNVYFARNVVLPQTNGSQLGPDKAPWVIFGGSYPGALVSWTMAAQVYFSSLIPSSDGISVTQTSSGLDIRRLVLFKLRCTYFHWTMTLA
jgi:hypothetical protein